MADNEIPDVYIDQMKVSTSVFGVNITFSLSEPHPTAGGTPQPTDKVRIRTSLEHAKIMTMLLKKQLKKYEKETGIDIGIPSQVYANLGIAKEDWGI